MIHGMRMPDTEATIEFCQPVDPDLFELLTGQQLGEPVPAPVHEVQVHAEMPARLITGRRDWTRSRAEHARVLRVARLRRRVARRSGHRSKMGSSPSAFRVTDRHFHLN